MPKNKIEILIADDDKDYLQKNCDNFKKEGFVVICTSKGKEVMEIVKDKKPDLILLDVMMLDTNGYKVVENLKTTKETKSVPVIMLSDLGHGEAIEKGILNGADDYIVKVNFTPEEVVEKVKIFLSE